MRDKIDLADRLEITRNAQRTEHGSTSIPITSRLSAYKKRTEKKHGEERWKGCDVASLVWWDEDETRMRDVLISRLNEWDGKHRGNWKERDRKERCYHGVLRVLPPSTLTRESRVRPVAWLLGRKTRVLVIDALCVCKYVCLCVLCVCVCLCVVKGNVSTNLATLPTTRLTHDVPVLPAPKLFAIVSYRLVVWSTLSLPLSPFLLSRSFSFSYRCSLSFTLLLLPLLSLLVSVFFSHNVIVTLWRRVYRYARVVKCLHVYRDEIQNLLRDAAQKIITWPSRTCSFEDSKFSSSISAWIAFYHEKKIILDLFFAVIFDHSNVAQKRISHCLNFVMKNRLRSTFERILLRIDTLYHFKDANMMKCWLSVSLRYAFYILEK